METERYEKGMEKLKELILKEGDSPTGHMDIGEGFKDIAPDLRKYVVEFAFGDIYARPGIDNKQKVLSTISALVAQGLPQIGMHVKTGLAVGLKPEEIVGCIMHLIPYCGFPKALNALRVAQEVFEEQGLKVDTSAVE
ncbi:MAG TPA: carboxymuconolactone decarboxylase family protein [Pseudogracilibacillus sp.]|nr:carboxymuconolactone decarboxylase family protein [Pseudogracilibacillus sp.]